MSSQILVAGAINTDLVANVERAPEAGETVTGRSFSVHSGGKGANQAVAVSRSGADAMMLGGVGKDDFGSKRIADLNEDSVNTTWVAALDDAESGVALITVESSGENRICYVPGATMQVSTAHVEAAVQSVSSPMILAANELPINCLEYIFGWAQQNNAPVVFNVAPYSDNAAVLLPLVDVLIVNRGEAEALQGAEANQKSPEQLAEGIRAMGVSSIVITLGKHGVFTMQDDQSFHEQALPVDVVDTTGAGDTFCGAFAARLVEGIEFREAIRYANAAGAWATTMPGAQSSIPMRHDVERLMAGNSH